MGPFTSRMLPYERECSITQKQVIYEAPHSSWVPEKGKRALHT